MVLPFALSLPSAIRKWTASEAALRWACFLPRKGLVGEPNDLSGWEGMVTVQA